MVTTNKHKNKMAEKLKTLEQLGIEEIPYSDTRDDNFDRHGDDGTNCMICGKPTKKVKYWINTIEGPDMVFASVTEEDMEANGLYPQGLFPIGSSCRKKLPKGYILKE